jgi:hypothetical protein
MSVEGRANLGPEPIRSEARRYVRSRESLNPREQERRLTSSIRAMMYAIDRLYDEAEDDAVALIAGGSNGRGGEVNIVENLAISEELRRARDALGQKVKALDGVLETCKAIKRELETLVGPTSPKEQRKNAGPLPGLPFPEDPAEASRRAAKMARQRDPEGYARLERQRAGR